MSTELVHSAQPSSGEFAIIVRQAEILSRSGIVPKPYRNRPDDIIAAALLGRTLGWDVSQSINSIQVIDGLASIKPMVQLGLIRYAGHSVTIVRESTKVTATGKRRDTGDEMVAVFTLDDAKRAGLAGKSNWRNYPIDMLQWRAVSILARGLFSDATLGLYTPDELGAVTDAEGEAIDPGEVVVMVGPAEAKMRLLEYAGGDKELAAKVWNGRGSNPIPATELDGLCDLATEHVIAAREAEADFEDAEVVDEDKPVDLVDTEPLDFDE